MPRLDLALLRSGLDTNEAAIAVVDEEGSLVCANNCYEQWFEGAVPPLELPVSEQDKARIQSAVTAVRRDGTAALEGLSLGGRKFDARLRIAGFDEKYLFWQFIHPDEADIGTEARRLVSGMGALASVKRE